MNPPKANFVALDTLAVLGATKLGEGQESLAQMPSGLV